MVPKCVMRLLPLCKVEDHYVSTLKVLPQSSIVTGPKSTRTHRTRSRAVPQLFILQNEKQKQSSSHLFLLSGCTCVAEGAITSTVTSASRDEAYSSRNLETVSSTYRIRDTNNRSGFSKPLPQQDANQEPKSVGHKRKRHLLPDRSGQTKGGTKSLSFQGQWRLGGTELLLYNSLFVFQTTKESHTVAGTALVLKHTLAHFLLQLQGQVCRFL